MSVQGAAFKRANFVSNRGDVSSTAKIERLLIVRLSAMGYCVAHFRRHISAG